MRSAEFISTRADWAFSGFITNPREPMRPPLPHSPQMPSRIPPVPTYELFSERPPFLNPAALALAPAPTLALAPASAPAPERAPERARARAPAPVPTEPLSSAGDATICRFASPCGVPLHVTSAKAVRQHLTDVHRADVDLHDGRARTRCPWRTRRGRCGRDVFCAMLPKHIAVAHLRHTSRACPRCGCVVSRVDALLRHLALYCREGRR